MLEALVVYLHFFFFFRAWQLKPEQLEMFFLIADTFKMFTRQKKELRA